MKLSLSVVGVEDVVERHFSTTKKRNIMAPGLGIIIAEPISGKEADWVTSVCSKVDDKLPAVSINTDLANIVMLMIIFPTSFAHDNADWSAAIP